MKQRIERREAAAAVFDSARQMELKRLAESRQRRRLIPLPFDLYIRATVYVIGVLDCLYDPEKDELVFIIADHFTRSDTCNHFAFCSHSYSH